MAYDFNPTVFGGIFHVSKNEMIRNSIEESFQLSLATFFHTEFDMEYTDNKNTLVIYIYFRL